MTEHGWGDAFYVKNIYDINDKIKIEYGTELVKFDITDVVFKNKHDNFILHIPCGDEIRSSLFTDPVYGVLKKIFIKSGNDKYIIESNDYAYIDINKDKLYINFNPIQN
jgi:hypothetical protein